MQNKTTKGSTGPAQDACLPTAQSAVKRTSSKKESRSENRAQHPRKKTNEKRKREEKATSKRCLFRLLQPRTKRPNKGREREGERECVCVSSGGAHSGKVAQRSNKGNKQGNNSPRSSFFAPFFFFSFLFFLTQLTRVMSSRKRRHSPQGGSSHKVTGPSPIFLDLCFGILINVTALSAQPHPRTHTLTRTRHTPHATRTRHTHTPHAHAHMLSDAATAEKTRGRWTHARPSEPGPQVPSKYLHHAAATWRRRFWKSV